MDFLLSQIVQSSHYGISELSQSERTYKKMNDYLYENGCVQMDASKRLSDEEIMMEVSNRKLHANRKKKLQKEKYRYGKSITHQGRIF